MEGIEPETARMAAEMGPETSVDVLDKPRLTPNA